MDQECESCGKRFRLSVLREVMGLSDYPIQSRARYCPYCGYNKDAPKLTQAAPDLLAACKALVAYRDAKVPLDKADYEFNQLRAAIAKAEAADD